MFPREVTDAVAAVLHDGECEDGDTTVCARWYLGLHPASQNHEVYHRPHVEAYRKRAVSVMWAAEQAMREAGPPPGRQAELAHQEGVRA